QQQGRTYPFRFRFLAHFTLMLEFFLCQNIGWRYRRGRQKKPHNSWFFFFFFFCWAQFFAPPSEWRPRPPPIPPLGKTAPACVCVCVCVCEIGRAHVCTPLT